MLKKRGIHRQVVVIKAQFREGFLKHGSKYSS